MQQPTSENSAIVSRKMWRIWEPDDPPRCEYIIQSWDTAFETKNNSDYSACTTWGIFYNEEENDTPQLMLLDAFKDRMAFPELKVVALKHYKEWEPDAFIVEKKAAGAPLIQELRALGIPVQEFSPSRGNDKMVRVNAVADLIHKKTGKSFNPLDRNTIEDKEITQAIDWVLEHFKVLTKKDVKAKLTPIQFWDMAVELKKHDELHTASIDSWKDLNHPYNDYGGYAQYLEYVLPYRNQIAEDNDLHLHTIIHPKLTEKENGKRTHHRKVRMEVLQTTRRCDRSPIRSTARKPRSQ